MSRDAGVIEWSEPGRVGEPRIRLRRTASAGTAGRRVLLLHGLGNSANVWQSVLRGWPDDVEVWAADLPWRGGCDSSWAVWGNCSGWMRTVLGLVPGGVDLVVAHSLSASVLLEALGNDGLDPRAFAAGREPGLMFVSPFFRPRPQDFEWEAIETALRNFERTISDGIRHHAGSRLSEEKVREIGQVVCQKIGPYGWATFFNLYLNTPWLHTERITVPSRVLVGEQDGAAPPAEGFRLAAALPAASALSVDCGHFPMIERPAEFLAAATGFLDELSTAERPNPGLGTAIASGVNT